MKKLTTAKIWQFALGIPESKINIKATTEEGLGFTGRGEGIASQAICLLIEKQD